MAELEKTCSQCAEQVKLAAMVCKHCGHTFSEEENTVAIDGNSTTKNIGIGCLVLLVLVILVGTCTPESKDDIDADTNAAIAADAEVMLDSLSGVSDADPPEEEMVLSAWRYSSRADELRGKTEHYAELVSENEARFDFPYNGGSTLRMTIRKSPQHGTDVIFRISKGQYVCGIYDCKGAISFDGKSEGLTLATPSDHSSDVLFAKYGEAIIRKLKSSDKTIVELPFYQEGNRQFTFDTKNLKWPPE